MTSPSSERRARAARKPRFVLDSSALLTMIKEAPGGSVVGAQLRQSAISAVNWSDVLTSARAHGVEVGNLRRDLELVGLEIFPFTAEDAEVASTFHDATHDLCTCDRACLALAARLGLPVLTADALWQKLAVGVDIQLIR